MYDLSLLLAASTLVALCAQVSITLPSSPVPITGQTLAVLLSGALLGSRRGAACLLAYLLEGALGLPVFAGGTAGLGKLLGPTGGYLIGFVAAAWVTGWLAERGWDRRPATAFVAMLTGNLTIYLFGLPWLAYFVGAEKVLTSGFFPFIAGDLLKLLLGTSLLPLGWKLVLNQTTDH